MRSIKLHKRSFDEFQYLLRSLQGRWSFVQYSVNAFAMLFLRVSWFHLNKENEIKMKICLQLRYYSTLYAKIVFLVSICVTLFVLGYWVQINGAKALSYQTWYQFSRFQRCHGEENKISKTLTWAVVILNAILTTLSPTNRNIWKERNYYIDSWVSRLS